MNFIPLLKKDLLRAFRNVFGVAMTFAAPLLITTLIAFAFGGFGGSEELQIQAIPVSVANLDAGSPGFSAGQLLLDFFRRDDVKDLVNLQEMPVEADAIAAVNYGIADVALIIPAGFSAAITGGASQVDVQILSDPAAEIGPSIVSSLTAQFIDGLNGTNITGKVVEDQLISRSQPTSPDLAHQVMLAYASWAEQTGSSEGGSAGVQTQAPPATSGSNTGMNRILGLIMAGQMVFFAFWTAANNALSLLREKDEGTLARLFTTPTGLRTILLSKFSMIAGFILVQILVLMIVSHYLLKIAWGSPAAVSLASLSLVVSASGFGVFVISLLKNIRQAGAVLGGLLTVMGMLAGLFTVGFTNLPAALNLGALITPHGWAMRLWKGAIENAPLGDAALPLIISLIAGLIFFAAGYRLFSRRFA